MENLPGPGEVGYASTTATVGTVGVFAGFGSGFSVVGGYNSNGDFVGTVQVTGPYGATAVYNITATISDNNIFGTPLPSGFTLNSFALGEGGVAGFGRGISTFAGVALNPNTGEVTVTAKVSGRALGGVAPTGSVTSSVVVVAGHAAPQGTTAGNNFSFSQGAVSNFLNSTS